MVIKQPNSRKKKSDAHGFAIVEVLIGMAIFAVGFLAVASMQITAANANAGSKFRTEATTLAADKIEHLMTLAYTDPELAAAPDPPRTPETSSRYTLSYTVADDTPVADAKTIKVLVSWRERGHQKQVTLDLIKVDL